MTLICIDGLEEQRAKIMIRSGPVLRNTAAFELNMETERSSVEEIHAAGPCIDL